MNIMGWIYSRVQNLLGSTGHSTLGFTLMIGEVIKLTDVKDFSLSLWLIFIICVCYYAAVFPFIGLGNMQSIQNLGLAIIAIAAGTILDSRGYLFLEVFFTACVCLSLIAVVMLYFVNHLTGKCMFILSLYIFSV
ncbi:Major facilitator superfamily domain-containing protein 1 [Chelonia mydas]|uniref:Major facilitator superfamily domain-containing protein 1 n=1 Tax=Chelonia mydas TaxID=8469 RepID=M7B489_CHEMY|nr:Major facilitator superfamily domain-containing protein 1 [Chelonia mydas]